MCELSQLSVCVTMCVYVSMFAFVEEVHACMRACVGVCVCGRAASCSMHHNGDVKPCRRTGITVAGKRIHKGCDVHRSGDYLNEVKAARVSLLIRFFGSTSHRGQRGAMQRICAADAALAGQVSLHRQSAWQLGIRCLPC